MKKNYGYRNFKISFFIELATVIAALSIIGLGCLLYLMIG